jgi:chromate transport protein ChrA
MLDAPPAEREGVSWAYLVACAVAICALVPFAPIIRDRVEAHWGRGIFLAATIAIVAVVFIVLLVRLRRRRRLPASAYLCLAAVGATYAWYAWQLRAIPEEALHLVEYGLLGVLAYRALSHRVHDPTIYLTAAIIGGLVGIVDETLQWLAPSRHWTLADLWINLGATALSQVAIAGGLRPRLIGRTPRAVGVRTFCRFAAPAIVLFGITLLNTPQRIEWYASRVPGLAFVRTIDSVMFEYGYLYRDPEAGVFRSRLDPATLAETDRRRGAEAARILEAYPDERYREFLNTYTPITDPFVHEARVHLFSRDKHVYLSRDPKLPPSEYGWHATVAWRENRILEKYFSETMRHSSRKLSADDAGYLERIRVPLEQVPETERESWVSRTLVTGVRESQIMLGLGALLLLVVVVERLASTRVSVLRATEERSA